MKTLNEYKELYNNLEYPKWKRVGFEGFDEIEEFELAQTMITNLDEFISQGGKVIKIDSSNDDIDDVYYRNYEKINDKFDEVDYGVDSKYTSLVESRFNAGVLLKVPKGVKIDTPIIIDYSLSLRKKYLYDLTFIHLENEAEAKVIIKYGMGEAGQHSGLTKVYLERDSHLQLVKLQSFDKEVKHVDNIVSYIEENGHVEYSSFELGAKVIVSSYLACLEGDRSFSDTYGAYLGTDNQRLDISYKSLHNGMKSTSNIDVRGALMHKAKKVFRGDLKFNKGAKKAVGKESEYVILLDKTVQSDAIPSLLCDEDDVVGEHAASAGQVDPSKLFYLMSRGFDEKKAKKLIIHGSFSSVIDRIMDDEIKNSVETILERRLVHE